MAMAMAAAATAIAFEVMVMAAAATVVAVEAVVMAAAPTVTAAPLQMECISHNQSFRRQSLLGIHPPGTDHRQHKKHEEHSDMQGTLAHSDLTIALRARSLDSPHRMIRRTM